VCAIPCLEICQGKARVPSPSTVAATRARKPASAPSAQRLSASLAHLLRADLSLRPSASPRRKRRLRSSAAQESTTSLLSPSNSKHTNPQGAKGQPNKESLNPLQSVRKCVHMREQRRHVARRARTHLCVCARRSAQQWHCMGAWVSVGAERGSGNGGPNLGEGAKEERVRRCELQRRRSSSVRCGRELGGNYALESCRGRTTDFVTGQLVDAHLPGAAAAHFRRASVASHLLLRTYSRRTRCRYARRIPPVISEPGPGDARPRGSAHTPCSGAMSSAILMLCLHSDGAPRHL
jgi:hypothetical protein